MVKGSGVYLYDNRENRYIDFTSGIGVVNTGHCHQKLLRQFRSRLCI